MTRQESFKRRVRARMARTGERYNAARRQLIEQAPRPGGRVWVSEPELGDDAVREATGRGWDEWCDLVDAWPGDHEDHGAITAHLEEKHGVPGWWAQTVAVGYERITGRRLPYQTADGTFTASKSRTVAVDAVALREMLLDADDRQDLFPGQETQLRSRPTSKNVRVAIGPGTAEFALDPKDNGRVKVTVAHHRLPTPQDVDEWKAYWAEWFEALDDA